MTVTPRLELNPIILPTVAPWRMSLIEPDDNAHIITMAGTAISIAIIIFYSLIIYWSLFSNMSAAS